MQFFRTLGALLALATLGACSRHYTFDREGGVNDMDVNSSDGTTQDSADEDAIQGDAGPAPMAPRLIGPISGSRIAGTPKVTVAAPGSTLDHLRVEMCADPACATVIGHTDSGGATSGATVSVALTMPTGSDAAGPMFWRAKSVSATGRESAPTVVWVMYRTHVHATNTGYVGMAMDMDRDGLGDFATSKPAPRDSVSVGSVQIVRGSATSVIDSAVITVPNMASSLHFGSNVGNVGDVNGDGFTDLVATATGSTSSPGTYLYLILGAADLHGLTATQVTSTGQTNFADTIAPLGDINGDGYGDVGIGTPGGLMSIFPGSPDGITATHTDVPSPYTDSLPDGFGTNITAIGDVDSDGLGDFAVFAPQHAPYDGFIYRGARNIMTNTWAPDRNIPAGNRAGFGSVVAAGDLSGRGRVDLAVRDNNWAVNVLYHQGTLSEGYVQTSTLNPPMQGWAASLAVLHREDADANVAYISAVNGAAHDLELMGCNVSGCTGTVVYTLSPAESGGLSFQTAAIPAQAGTYVVDSIVSAYGTDPAALSRLAVFTPPGTSACATCILHGDVLSDGFGSVLSSMH